MRTSDLLAVIVVLCFIHEAASQTMGPTNTVITGTFTGSDFSTPCKWCQINCLDIPVFQNNSCANTYYTFGCDIKHPCPSITSANKLEFYTAVALCAKFNQCKLQVFLLDSFKYPSVIKGEPDYGAEHLMDLFLFQNLGLNWRSAVKNLGTGQDYVASKFNFKIESQKFITNEEKDLNNLSSTPLFNQVNAKERLRALNYLWKNFYRKQERLAAQTRDPAAVSALGVFASAAAFEKKEKQDLDDDTRRRKFREVMLLNLRPVIPSSTYLNYKLVQDYRLDPSLGLQVVEDIAFPTWFKNSMSLLKLEKADQDGLIAQVKANKVRIEQLMNWINTYAASNYKAYFDTYIALLAAGSLISDEYSGVAEKQVCSYEESVKLKVPRSGLDRENCLAVNTKVEMEAKLVQIEKAVAQSYLLLLQDLFKQSGLNKDTSINLETWFGDSYVPSNSKTVKSLGTIAQKLFFR